MQNTLVLGVTRKGKSTIVLTEDIIPVIESRICAVTILDPHSSMGNRAAQYCATMGHEKRLIVDNLGNLKDIASPGIIRRSTNPDPIEREAENR